MQYRVTSLQDLINIIIPHFDKYPLLTQTRADFELFKKFIDIMSREGHKTIEGLQQIVNIKATINKGLSDNLKINFPNTIPVLRPLVEEIQIFEPNWVAGFASGEGCFLITIFKSKTKLGQAVKLEFQLTQHFRDEQLMKSLISYFGCGKVYSRFNLETKIKAIDFKILKIKDLTDIIIPFFDKYPILGVKSKDFYDLKRAAELMKNEAHLTSEGLEEIRLIKVGMNRGRK